MLQLSYISRVFPAHVAACLRFYSRLPLPSRAFGSEAYAMFDFGRAASAVPVAGALIGAVGALALVVASALGLPPLAVSLVALATLVVATGALHEDGLADCADGFGGGKTREAKLAIMKDSRVGTYGAVALVLSLGLRAAALAALLDHGVAAAAAAIVAAAAVSRTLTLLPLTLLAPARADGAGHDAARPEGWPLFSAAALALLIGFAPMLAGLGFGHLLAVMLVASAAALAMTGLAFRAIGGQTGDVAGAAQQVAEIAFLCALVAAPGL
jgi:adenosylcobinamide-GDP ribazoletransferase